LPTSMSDTLAMEFSKRPEQSAQTYRRTFSKLAVDGIVTTDSLQVIANKIAARERASVIAKILGADINGDGSISVNEALSLSQTQTYNWSSQTPRYLPLGDADSNGDGMITMSEILQFSRNSRQISKLINNSRELAINSFDANKDGIINTQELDEGLSALAESSVKRQLRPTSKPTINTPPKECIPASPKENTEVIFVSGYEGSGLSSVALTGMDRESEVARLVIEKGDRPLYIVATSHTPLVWKIEGDVSRVARFVTQPNHNIKGPGVGVVGLPKDKVEFIGRGCLNNFWDSSNVKAIQAKALWGKVVGKPPDNIYGNYKIVSLHLPSGKNTDKKAISEMQLKSRVRQGDTFGLYRYTIEGLITIEPKDVIAPSPVKTYDVMPQQAGLVQLVKSGHMVAIERGAFKIVKPFLVFRQGSVVGIA